jgi:hypothetical protein
MSGQMANLMSANGSVSSMRSESRSLRLPRVNPFPKLDGNGLRVVSTATPTSRPVPRTGAVLLACGGGVLPEMATDVIDQDANYAVQNVKRDRSDSRRWAGVGLGRWLGEMLGGHRIARL